MKAMIRYFMLLLLLGVAAGSVRAEDIDAVKARMAKRQPLIAEMKQARAVGENNRGYLEILDTDRADAKVVAAENADRRLVYEAIASDTKADADTVGRLRAKQIAERSKAGIMIQGEDGNWHAKGAGRGG